MKIYFHMNVDCFSNTYVVVNEVEKKVAQSAATFLGSQMEI